MQFSEDLSPEDAEKVRERSDEEIITAIKDKHYDYYISYFERLGASSLCALMEYHYFHPRFGPDSNDKFRWMLREWRGVRYMIFGIPHRSHQKKLTDMIRKLGGLRIADGVPGEIVPLTGSYENSRIRITGAHRPSKVGYKVGYMKKEGVKMIVFPGAVEGERFRVNFWTIENEDITNRRDLDEQIRRREIKALDMLAAFGRKVTPEMVRDYVWFGQLPDETKGKPN